MALTKDDEDKFRETFKEGLSSVFFSGMYDNIDDVLMEMRCSFKDPSVAKGTDVYKALLHLKQILEERI